MERQIRGKEEKVVSLGDKFLPSAPHILTHVKRKDRLTTTVTNHFPSPTPLNNPLVLVSFAKSISHSPQISNASSRQALKDSSSMIVGWAISLPGKTPQVTASTSPRERLDS